MIYVYTSILNGWDNLRPPACVFGSDVRFVCFTNLPTLPKVEPWEYRPLYDVGQACRTARVPKILPHLMLPADAEYSIYHDGNFQLKVNPRALLEATLNHADWAAHRHPCRNCIYDEAAILLREKIGTPDLVLQEVAKYRAMRFPEQVGLWANGLLIRRHTSEVAAVCEQWWKLYATGCERDQLSFPVAKSIWNLPVHSIREQIYHSPFLNFYFHAAWKDQPANQEYAADRAAQRTRLAHLARIAGPAHGVSYPEY